MRRNAFIVIAVAVIAIIAAWRLWPHHDRGEASASSANAANKSRTGVRAAEAKPASLAGRVERASDHGGIAGAIVSIVHSDFKELSAADAPTIVVTADASGAFTAPKVPPGQYVIAATAPGFLPKKLGKVWLDSGEQKTGVVLALDAGGMTVRGTVSDIGGGGVPGARVTVKGRDTFDWQPAEFVALSGADGTYQLSLPDGNFSAVASHDEYTRVEHDLEVASKPVTLDFVLTPGGVVRGQVIARDTNKPVPHAIVTAHSRGRWDNDGAMPSTTTDDEGTFTVKSLKPGLISISAAARGYASVAPTTVEVGIGEQVDNVRVLVDRAYSISGRVIEKGGKKGIPNVHVGAFSMAQGKQAMDPDPSDDDGKFEIIGVRPGNYMLFAFGEGNVPEIGKSVEVVDKDVTGVELELQTGVTVTGRVDPPQVASVSLELAGEVGLANMFEAVKTMMVKAESDATGAFKLEHVPTGAFKIVARTTAGPRGEQPIVVAASDQANVVVHLEVRASVSGKVMDTNGNPVAGAEVAVRGTDEKPQFFSERGNSARTAADGSFKVVGLDAGTYTVVASSSEDDRFAEMIEERQQQKDKKKKPLEVELAAGAEKTGIVLTIEARDGVIKGQVIGSDGKPAPDAWVTARLVVATAKIKVEASGDDMDQTWWPTTEPVLTDANGKFTIQKLKHGTYTVIADGPRGSSRAEKTGVKTGDSVTINLQPLGSLSGHVMLRGAPVTTYSIDCRGPAGNIDRPVAAADGSYSLEHLAPGKYMCSVDSDAGTAVGGIEVPVGAATLELQLKPWASITGVVVSMFSGAPVPQIAAVPTSNNGRDMMALITGGAPKTDATGRFSLDKVGAGSGAVMIMDPAAGGFTPLATKQYTATEGQRVDLGTIKIVPPRHGDAGTFGMTVEPDMSGSAATGVVVMNVKPGGPADQAGVKVDDKIASIGGKSVTDLGPMQAVTYLSSGSIGVGEVVQLTLDRGGQQQQVSITSVKW